MLLVLVGTQGLDISLSLQSEAAPGQDGGSPGRSRKWHSPGSAICFLFSSNTRELRFSSNTLGWGSGGASSSRMDLEYRRRQDPERRKALEVISHGLCEMTSVFFLV